MKKPRWLKGRPGVVTPEIVVFDDPQEDAMYLDKPVEVKVDGNNKIAYVWLKLGGDWRVQTAPVGGALDGIVLSDGPQLPPWPAP